MPSKTQAKDNGKLAQSYKRNEARYGCMCIEGVAYMNMSNKAWKH